MNGVSLKDFISSTLVDISDSLKIASSKEKGRFKMGHYKGTELIEFDIAVVGSKVEGGKAGVEVFSIGAGIKTQSTSEVTSRVKFKVKFWPR